MRVRSLGTDGPKVAAVGLGDVSLARAAARGVDAGEVERALHEAIGGGIDVKRWLLDFEKNLRL